MLLAEHEGGNKRKLESGGGDPAGVESDEQLARRLHEELNSLTRSSRRGAPPQPRAAAPKPAAKKPAKEGAGGSSSGKLAAGAASKQEAPQQPQQDEDDGRERPRKRVAVNRELAMLTTDMVETQIKPAPGVRAKVKDEPGSEQQQQQQGQPGAQRRPSQQGDALKHESSSSLSEQERLAVEHVAAGDGGEAAQPAHRQLAVARASESGAAPGESCTTGATSSAGDQDQQHTSHHPVTRLQQQPGRRGEHEGEQQQQHQHHSARPRAAHAHQHGGAKQQPQPGEQQQQLLLQRAGTLGSSAGGGGGGPAGPKPIKIPKLPMVQYGKKWYRARVMKDAGPRVQLEYQGFSHEGGPFWLPKDHPRIWRGSMKGRDWKYLGDGAWEPKALSKQDGGKARFGSKRVRCGPSSRHAGSEDAGDGSDAEQQPAARTPQRRRSLAAGVAEAGGSERDTTSADQEVGGDELDTEDEAEPLTVDSPAVPEARSRLGRQHSAREPEEQQQQQRRRRASDTGGDGGSRPAQQESPASERRRRGAGGERSSEPACNGLSLELPEAAGGEGELPEREASGQLTSRGRTRSGRAPRTTAAGEDEAAAAAARPAKRARGGGGGRGKSAAAVQPLEAAGEAAVAAEGAGLQIDASRAPLKHSSSSDGLPASPTSPGGAGCSPKAGHRRKGVPQRARLDSAELPAKLGRGSNGSVSSRSGGSGGGAPGSGGGAAAAPAGGWGASDADAPESSRASEQAPRHMGGWKGGGAKKGMWAGGQQQGEAAGGGGKKGRGAAKGAKAQLGGYHGPPTPYEQQQLQWEYEAAFAEAAQAAQQAGRAHILAAAAAAAADMQQEAAAQLLGGSEPEDLEAACVLVGASMGRAHSGEVYGLGDAALGVQGSLTRGGYDEPLSPRGFASAAAQHAGRQHHSSSSHGGAGHGHAHAHGANGKRRGHNWSKPLRPPRPPPPHAAGMLAGLGRRPSLQGSLYGGPGGGGSELFSGLLDHSSAGGLGLARPHIGGAGRLGSGPAGAGGGLRNGSCLLFGAPSSGGSGGGGPGGSDAAKSATLRALLDAVGEVQASSGRPDMLFPLQYHGLGLGAPEPRLQLAHTPLSSAAAALLAAVPSLGVVHTMAAMQGQAGALACLNGGAAPLFLP